MPNLLSNAQKVIKENHLADFFVTTQYGNIIRQYD